MSWKVAMLILKGSWKYYWSCRTWVVLSSFSPSWVAAHTGEQTEVPATTSLDVTAVPLLPHGWNRGISLPHPWMKQEYSLWLLAWNKCTPYHPPGWNRDTPTTPLDETGLPPLPLWRKRRYPQSPVEWKVGINLHMVLCASIQDHLRPALQELPFFGIFGIPD